jgi:hypothetical protein
MSTGYWCLTRLLPRPVDGCSGHRIRVNVSVKYLMCVWRYQAVFPSIPPSYTPPRKQDHREEKKGTHQPECVRKTGRTLQVKVGDWKRKLVFPNINSCVFITTAVNTFGSTSRMCRRQWKFRGTSKPGYLPLEKRERRHCTACAAATGVCLLRWVKLEFFWIFNQNKGNKIECEVGVTVLQLPWLVLRS